MYKLFEFFKRYYVLILFLILESMAINHYARSSSFTRARILTAANTVTVDINESISKAGSYFSLSEDNRSLTERIAELENELSAYRDYFSDSTHMAGTDTLNDFIKDSPYKFFTARVVSNSITGQKNYFVLNKGTGDGIEPNMAVLTTDGKVVGYVEACTANLSACMSIINTDFKLGGHIKGKDFMGSVHWDAQSHRVVTLSEMPRYADVRIGDTVTSIYSQRFPPDSFIGTVASIGYSDDNSFYKIEVELAADISRLKDVLVVGHENSEELLELKEQIDGINY